jgi:hypothetical protein
MPPALLWFSTLAIVTGVALFVSAFALTAAGTQADEGGIRISVLAR